ncbi:putative serine/threonine-protein kinase [Paramyrothecium foliicola]|nr:putative serine/threonine-protein kinase [Paramyrothecium foliicola]
MVAELVLGVIGAIDVCIRASNKIFQTCKAFRRADHELEEKLIVVEATWTKVEIQLSFLKRVAAHVDERLVESHCALLHVLYGKLAQADKQLEMPESEIKRKLKYSLIKKRLDELVTELETWQKRFDPTWYLVILMNNSAIDAGLSEEISERVGIASQGVGPLENMMGLRRAIKASNFNGEVADTKAPSVNLNASGLQDAAVLPIPYSSARIVIRKGSAKILIAETIESLDYDISQVRQMAENLARKLKQVDTNAFCLLQCYGILKHRDSMSSRAITAIEMIYKTPAESKQPTSLRDLLLRQQAVSVSAKVRLAKQLVQSVSYVHAFDFVHKGIRPENILIFPNESSALGASFLVGFSQFRESHFQTNLRGDTCWHRNIYRHPQRQGQFVVDRYVMQHDIYSLGVCLLEIGLWGSFVWFPRDSEDVVPVPGMALQMNISDTDFESIRTASLGQTKNHFLSLAKTELPSRVGDLYTSIVVSCLTCLDADNEDFGSEQELQDEDGILVGVRFVEKVMLRMEDISV